MHHIHEKIVVKFELIVDKYLVKILLFICCLFPLGLFAQSTDCTNLEFGKRCLTKIANYPEPVFIFIPKSFNPEKEFSLLLFMHGHLLANSNYQTDVLNRFQFEKKLSSLQRNLIMIMPLSKGLGQDYDDYFFKTPQAKINFQTFQTAVTSALKNLGINLDFQSKLILGGHSGAYRHLATFLKYDLPKLTEVYLFDCLYSKYEAPRIYANTFLRFKNENKRFLSFFKLNSGTDQANFETWRMTKQPSEITTRNQFYKESITVSQFAHLNNLQQNFIKTDKNHYQIVDDFFIWALESGELNRKKSLR